MIYSEPSRYGFYIREKDLYPPIPYFEVQVDSSINNLVDFAKKYNISYRVFKDFNPWLTNSKLINNSGKTYTIIIPKADQLTYDSFLIRHESDERIFNDTLTINQL
jgi:hypothetical protein